MKVAFDEHVPPALAKVFITLANERAIRKASGDLVLEKAEDYAPQKTDSDYVRRNDVPWLDRFAAAGGRAVISGDVKMRQRPHERLALYQHGFVVIFFEPQWSRWNFFRKSGLILHWWKEITDKIKLGDRGTFWVVPAAFPLEGGELRNVSLGLAQLLTDNPRRIEKPSRSRKRPARPKVATLSESPPSFLGLLEERHAASKEEG